MAVDGPVHGFDPDWVISPGETLKDWLEENRVSPRVLSVACGTDRATIEGVLAGNKPIKKALARKLAQGTGIPARLWLNLERQFRQGLAEGKTWVR